MKKQPRQQYQKISAHCHDHHIRAPSRPLKYSQHSIQEDSKGKENALRNTTDLEKTMQNVNCISQLISRQTNNVYMSLLNITQLQTTVRHYTSQLNNL